MTKGFRKSKKPTKNEVNKKTTDTLNLALAEINQMRLMFGRSITNLRQEQTALINLLRTTETLEPVKKGDKVQVDYIGRLLKEDGSLGDLFDGNYGLGYIVDIGSGSLIPGFEDKLIGMRKDATKEIDLTFPEQYSNDLKGKNVRFIVRLSKVYNIPKDDDSITKIRDEWVKETTPKLVKASSVEGIAEVKKGETLEEAENRVAKEIEEAPKKDKLTPSGA